MVLSFFKGKRVLLTGHTGFKGSWLCEALLMAGARITGFSLEPPTEPSLFSLCGLEKRMDSVIGDVRDKEALEAAFKRADPEIVFHLAAQPLVLDSYKRPAYTYETNVMGTVNLLECVRGAREGSVRSVVNVTTDKVYRNNEWDWGYRESDELDGFDPYSNSKSCSELVTRSYRDCFLANNGTAVSTARAGNVIGGGDFADNRIIPDCIRAAIRGEQVSLRNPGSTRPYQHVLEPVFAYLNIAAAQADDCTLAGPYNVGPDDRDCVTTLELVRLFCEEWGGGMGYVCAGTDGPHEAGFLKLDCSSMRKAFSWRPRWSVGTAVKKTVEWTKGWISGEDAGEIMRRQIDSFISEENYV